MEKYNMTKMIPINNPNVKPETDINDLPSQKFLDLVPESFKYESN